MGYSHLGSLMPRSTQVVEVARVGFEPTSSRCLRPVALPVCHRTKQAPQRGFEPPISTLTVWRPLRAEPLR